jgi:S-adenosylmethionine decarboxylase
MAFNDTLFQLGMDLTRSSTTQAEEFGSPSSRVPEARPEQSGSLIARDGIKFAGTHLVIDVFGAEHLGDLETVERALKGCVEAVGAEALHSHLHHTVPGKGISGIAVLSEGHISVHSFPDATYAAFDVFLGNTVRPNMIVAVLRKVFAARDVLVREHKRGGEAAAETAARLAKARRYAPRVAKSAKARVKAA